MVVNVTWTEPAQPNGVITGYVVMYSEYENSTFTGSGMLEGSDTSFLIENLGKDKQ